MSDRECQFCKKPLLDDQPLLCYDCAQELKLRKKIRLAELWQGYPVDDPE